VIFNGIDDLVARERQAELLRQAERDRLSELARSTQRKCCCIDGVESTCS
jgi:hypothetical protein